MGGVNGLSFSGTFAQSACRTDNLRQQFMGLTPAAGDGEIDHTIGSSGQMKRAD